MRECAKGQPEAVSGKHRHDAGDTGREQHRRPLTAAMACHASGNAGFYEAAIVRSRKTEFRACRHAEDMSAVHPSLTMIANTPRVT